MRIGLQVAPERGLYREKVTRLIGDARRAEDGGFDTVWVPQIPNEFEALTALALMGHSTERIELGTAVLPIQSRHPVAMAQQALSTQIACGGRLTLGIGASHHWLVEGMLGLPNDKPARLMRNYLEVLAAALAATGNVDVENESFRVHQPFDITDAPVPIVLAALGPVMLRLAGEHATGTITWLADEKAIAEHIAPRIGKAAADAGRPAPRIIAGVPATLCRPDEEAGARAWAARYLGEAESSPNYRRLLAHGDVDDVSGMLMAGDEDAVVARVRRFRDAGVTDLAVRVLPFGANRDDRLASLQRTTDFFASLARGGDLA